MAKWNACVTDTMFTQRRTSTDCNLILPYRLLQMSSSLCASAAATSLAGSLDPPENKSQTPA
jgi:hypothetical protein